MTEVKIVKNVSKPESGRGIATKYPLLKELKVGEALQVPQDERSAARSAMNWIAKQQTPAWEWESWTARDPADSKAKIIYIKRLT